MSFYRSVGGLEEHDNRFFKVYKILSSEARQTLLIIFHWGCEKKEEETLEEYLKKKGMSSRDYKNMFDVTMRETIKKNPSCSKFDVSLLFACIKNSCVKLADKNDEVWRAGDDTRLESICTSIKNFRNNLIHSTPVIGDDAEMNAQVQLVQRWLVTALRLAGNLYEHQESVVDNLIQEMQNSIKKIMKTPLSHLDIVQYQKEIKEFREKQKDIVRKEGIPELSCKYKNKSKIDPASFITGKERLPVKSIFTQLEVIREEQDRPTHENVDYRTILELTTNDESTPTIILVEGEAGAGKTTLTKLILDSWADWNDSKVLPIFQSLRTYQLVLYTEARNQSLSSFLSLLTVLMSNASYAMCDEDLERSVLNMEVLLIIDGLDELNDASRKLLNEVFEKQIPRSHGKLHLLITTRPNVLPDLPSLLHSESRVHIVLRGVTQENRVEFITKLHDEMITADQSQQKTQDLVDFIKQSQTRLGEQYRLPLNLTLVTYLFASDPKRINLVTTSTGLYVAMHELIKSRLLKRLLDQSNTATNSDELNDKCEKFLKDLYYVCLQTHSSGHIQLSSDSTYRLRSKCEELDLTYYEMCSAFLAIEKEWTPRGYKLDLFVPHKSIMEFYAAYRIFLDKFDHTGQEEMQEVAKLLCKFEMTEKEKENILQTIEEKKKDRKSLSDIMKNLLQDNVAGKLSDYQNVLLHLGGLIAHEQPDKLQENGRELVELLHEAGVEGTQWLDLVAETECNDTITSSAASHISKQLVVRDGHTVAALKIFKHLPTNIPVQIILENEVHYIPCLNELLDELSSRRCDVEFLLKHQWKHSQYGTSDKLLERLTKNKGNEGCRVYRFTGHLEDLAVLPVHLEDLRITIASCSHARTICGQLAEFVKNNPLKYLGVHVMREVTPESLKPLPVVKARDKLCGTLWLSDVRDNVRQACKVARALLPKDGQFSSIKFPHTTLSFTKCKELLRGLKDEGVKVRYKGGIQLFCHGLTVDQQYDLRELSRYILDCELTCNVDSSSMW